MISWPIVVQKNALPMPSLPFARISNKPLSHRAGIGHAQIGAERLHAFSDPGIHSPDTNRPGVNVSSDGLVVIPDVPCHARILTILLITRQLEMKPNGWHQARLKAGARYERTLLVSAPVPG
jgi:hypothetical protein